MVLSSSELHRKVMKALPQFNEKMVKMQIKMVKEILPILPEIFDTELFVLPVI
jgi:hypothetical protein